MKTILFLFVLIFSQFAFPQVVTTSPQFPTENDSIVVYFDATKGDAGLKGFTGDVYAHTGVITTLSNGSSDWRYVMAAWGSNYPDIKMTRDSADHYHLVIGYPRKYYSSNHQNLGAIPDNELIKQLAFVFRNSDGSKTGRDVGGADILYSLYQPNSYTLKLISPEISGNYKDPLNSPVFLKSTDTLDIITKAAVLGTQNSSITLFINGSQINQTTSDSLNYKFLASHYTSRINRIVLVGKDNTGNTDSLKFAVVINTAVKIEPMPKGKELGINYDSPSSVTLALYAPRKSYVYAIGDFNNWEVDTSYFMNKDSSGADSVIWWVTINNLSPGTEYAFQYMVDGKLRIADPYAHLILDPNNDKYIPSTVYPNLKAYPAGKTSEIVSVLQTAQGQYNWQVKDFKRPDKSNLVIYELLVRDFVSTHDYKTLTDTIGYFKRLGINAIELMPVMEFEGNDSWGYNPDFHLALDKYYGTKNDLKHFIDVCHENGIAVILDVVLNHIMGSSPLARLYWDAANNRPAADNPWLNPIPKHPYNVGNDFNHESPQTQYYADRVTKYWLSEFHIDGFRFDLSKGFTQKNTLGNVDAWGQYDQSRINILERMGNKIWQTDSNAILILEHFAVLQEEKALSDFGFLSWGNFNYNYSQASMGYRYGPSGDDYSWDLSNVYYKNAGWPRPSRVTYMESHDEERLMYKNLQFGNSDSAFYSIKDLNTALNRIKLCEAFFYTVPGPKMLWQFGELGYDYSIDYNSRTGDKPIRWDYYNNPARLSLYKTTAALIRLKENYKAFESDSVITDLKNNIKRIYIIDSSMNVAVFGNFDVYYHDINPAFPTEGMWYDYLTGDSITATFGHGSVKLNPGDFRIYTTVKLPVPDLEVPDGIKKNGNTDIKNYMLEQNYPNPFNPSTRIRYRLPAAGLVTLKVYDILGNEVKTLVNGYEASGQHSVTFNAGSLASSVYFYQIRVNNFVFSRKMILIK